MIEKYKELVELYDHYLALINDSNSTPILLASVRGWKALEADIEAGKEFRKKIKALRDELSLGRSVASGPNED